MPERGRHEGPVLVDWRPARYDPARGEPAAPSPAFEEVVVIAWLAPAAMFWTVTALYLGGFPLRIEGGGGLRHIIGLLATFVLFMLVFAGVHMVLLGMAGPILSVALSCVVCTLLLPILSRVGFMLLGVKIRTMPAHY